MDILKGIQPRGGFRALMLRSVLFAFSLAFNAVDLPAQEQQKSLPREMTQYVLDARKACSGDAECRLAAARRRRHQKLPPGASAGAEMDYACRVYGESGGMQARIGCETMNLALRRV